MKKLLFITMLLGALYSQYQCEDYNSSWGTNYNCDCNASTWGQYYNSEGRNMEGCWLHGADLDGANFTEANLSGAMFADARLEQANFYAANLSGADLQSAMLVDVTFEATNLCNLSGSGFDWYGGGECEELSGITDDNGDGYDDVSFDEGYISGTSAGDVNLDGNLNITDIILYIEAILAD